MSLKLNLFYCAEMEKDELPPVTEDATDHGGGLQVSSCLKFVRLIQLIFQKF